MEFVATKEQQAILDADLVPVKVIACAGSGKTATAVRRLVEVRCRMGSSRGYAVLLSYSNVAVDIFRREYRQVAGKYSNISGRVLISTVDSFIANNILLPHGAAVMGCSCRPFLVHGRERFLENKAFNVFDGTRPVPITKVDLRSVGHDSWEFFNTDSRQPLPEGNAIKAANSLAKTGAYTHAMGRMWALSALTNVDGLAAILAKRYPHILIDEAQDIGSLHGDTLLQLEAAGSVLGLVGDPNQAIYEFADADGSFLKEFKLPVHGLNQPLTENRRSVSQVVAVSNRIGNVASTCIRAVPKRKHGSYFIKYDPNRLQDLIATFETILDENDYPRENVAILARGTSLSYQLGGGKGSFGQGATKLFVEAAVKRDMHGDIAAAFELTLDGMLRLVETSDNGIRLKVLSGQREPIVRSLRKQVWKFLRDEPTGIPHASLAGDKWHAELKKRLPAVLGSIQSICGMSPRKSWGMNVTVKELGREPLLQESLIAHTAQSIRISTVHKTKGESIAAVLYVTNTKSLNSLLRGTVNEEGRIAYVAITRASDLLVLAVQNSITTAKLVSLKKIGFVEWAM